MSASFLPSSKGGGRLFFGAVADDDTGASDLAGMLAEHGMRTLLVIDLPEQSQFEEWSEGRHAVVMAAGTRNLPAEEARARTRAALRLLKTMGPRTFQIKYCSTFDSTPEGNIGPSIDAALEELREDFTVALPALPVNGRTTYHGYHFVHDRLLSDSPMREHPLTPMTESNLVAHLGRQTSRRVGLVPYELVEAGDREVRYEFSRLHVVEGVSVAVVDCLNDRHVETICRAATDLRLVTGSSVFGQGLPAAWYERGWARWPDIRPEPSPGAGVEGRGRLVVAGSCSAATRAQNRWFESNGAPAFCLDPRELLGDDFGRASLVAGVAAHLAAGRDCLLYTTDEPAEVARVQEWAAGEGMDVAGLGRSIAYALADLVAELLESAPAGGLLFAGGETSGALCRRLSLGALRVGRNIEPGVPLCHSLGRHRLPVVLKSGNFGGEDFYGRALAAVKSPETYFLLEGGRMTEEAALESLCEAADSFYSRGYAFGSTGNISVRAGGRVWITPTGKSLRGLKPARLACVGLDGASLNGNRPSKEFPFHLAVYARREDVRAVVHLHALYSVALSCLDAFDAENPLPPLTPYYFMRVAPLAVLPYFRPGSEGLADAVGEAAPRHNCMLLRNHGVVCAGSTLSEAVDRAEELEQTARLHFILRGERVRHLTPEQVEELKRAFG